MNTKTSIFTMKRAALCFTLFFAFHFSFINPLGAQVAINTTSANPDPSAILDLNSGNAGVNKGFLPPQVALTDVTIAAPVTGPATGLIVYSTSVPIGGNGVGYYYWTGTVWANLSGSITGTGTTNYLARWTSPAALGTGVAQDNGVGVGISGTAITPASLVDINGNVTIGAYAGTNAAPANGIIVSGQVGIGTNAPNASAALDVTSTTAGLLPPRMTAAQMNAIASPAIGLLVLNSTTNCLEYWSGLAWQNVVCPCLGPPSTPGSITGSTTACESSTGNIYSISAVAGASSYTWTVPTGSLITSGQGTTSITVTFGTTNGIITVTANNSCGISGPATLTINLTAIPAAPATPSGNTSPTISTSDTYTIAPIAGATGYKWSVSTTNGSVTAGQGTTSATITFSGTSGTMSICVYDSNACGKSSPTCLSVTSTACSGAISLDGSVITYVNYPSTTDPSTLTISTSTPNELILVTITGYPQFAGTVTCSNAGSSTQLVNFYNNQATDATYGFIPTATGTHTVTVTGWGTYPGYGQVYAAAFMGFCSTPTIAADVSPYPVTLGTAPSDFGAAPATLTTTITPPQANSYVYGVFDNSMGADKAMGTITWTNLTKLAATNNPYYSWDMSVAGMQVPTTTPYSVSCQDTQSDWSGNATILDLYDIH